MKLRGRGGRARARALHRVARARAHVEAVDVVLDAVAVVVDAVAGDLPRIGPDVGGQIGVIEVDPRIDDADVDRRGPGVAGGPRLARLAPVWVRRQPGPTRSSLT